MIKKKCYSDRFIVQGKKQAHLFILNDMNHPHPGVFLFADDFEVDVPHIVYLENSESVSESVEKLMNNPQVGEPLSHCTLGVALPQLPNEREKTFCDIWGNLGYIPKYNEMLAYFSNSLSP